MIDDRRRNLSRHRNLSVFSYYQSDDSKEGVPNCGPPLAFSCINGFCDKPRYQQRCQIHGENTRWKLGFEPRVLLQPFPEWELDADTEGCAVSGRTARRQSCVSLGLFGSPEGVLGKVKKGQRQREKGMGEKE